MPSDERWKRDLRLDLKKKKKKRNREKEKRGKDTRDATPDTTQRGSGFGVTDGATATGW